MSPSPQPRLLPVVMIALALFALARIGDVWVGFAGANAEESAPASAASQAASSALAPPLASASVSDERLLGHLAARRVELDRREQALLTREALLKAAEARIETRLAELAVRDAEVVARESGMRADEAARLAKLSDAYERMKPRDAARIFEALDAALLGPVASGMRTQSLAAVLGEMDSGKATQLTQWLARDGAPAEPEVAP